MKAVIFDMDGLMFDTERIFVGAYDYAGEKLNIGKTGFMAIKTLGMNMEMAKKIWFEQFGHDFKPELFRKFVGEFFENYYQSNQLPIKKGLYNLLAFLEKSGYKMAVASSSPQKVVLNYLTLSDTKKYFSAIVCGDMVEKSKPEPDIFLCAAKLLAENPCDCYALEDSKSGLTSAFRAGCKTIMIPDMWQPDKEVLSFITAKLNDLDEVIDFISHQQSV